MSGGVRIGIDVGGTNTDAVAVSGRRVMASVKRPTTPVVADGIIHALCSLLQTSAFRPRDVTAVMVGTTQFVNAFVQASGLARTGVLRLGLPATLALPPLVDWPDSLRRELGGLVFLCRGGHDYDGTEIAPLDRGRLHRVADRLAEAGAVSAAITSVFSPINAEFETEAAAILAERLPQLHITLSSEIGRIGLLERENATIINACLRTLAAQTVQGLEDAVAAAGITGPLFMSQNDGTLMNAEYARKFPVATFASGPTNSMRGAAFLSGLGEAAVADVGGTTTDIGVLSRGFPRQAPLAAEIGGVRTNFRMPDVLSLGIGGGSIVRPGAVSAGDARVGPDSAGYELLTRGLVFGGDTLTATDLAVAAGRAEIGDPALARGVDRAMVEGGLAFIEAEVAEAIDRMKISADPVPVVVVGGGGPLVPDCLPGASRVVRPERGEVANAIGAAMAQAGGEVDRIIHAGESGRRRAVDQVISEAAARAVDAGADPDSVEVVEIDEVPVSYLPGNALRVRVKAVGDLRIGAAT
jgi:N-methylhydantoinase A/oxoprolinase/acetone carboxylase beta subunit